MPAFSFNMETLFFPFELFTLPSSVMPRCPKEPWILQHAVSVEATFILEVKVVVKARTMLCSQCRLELYKVWAAVKCPVVLPGPLTKGQICLLPNILSSLKYQLDLGSNYNSRYTRKIIFRCMYVSLFIEKFRSLDARWGLWYEQGKYGVCRHDFCS